MTIFTRYLLREQIYYFLILGAIFCSVLIAKETYDTRDEMLDESPAPMDVIEYIVLTIPAQLVDAVPVVSIFAVLFAFGLMARNREILAMVGLGASFARLAFPVGVFGSIISVLTFVFADRVVPLAQQRARFIYEIRIKGENLYAFTSNDEIFRKGEGNRFYYMANYDSVTKTMTRPGILIRNEQRNGLARRIEGSAARLIDAPEGQEQLWEFDGAEVWDFDQGETAEVVKWDVPLDLKLEEKLDTFLSRQSRPEEMSLNELRDYGEILTRQGGGPQVPVYRTAVYAKFTAAVSCLLLSMAGFCIAADLTLRRFVFAFTFGLLFVIFYYLVRESFLGLGRAGILMPSLAAWAPVALFGLFVSVLFHRLNSVH